MHGQGLSGLVKTVCLRVSSQGEWSLGPGHVALGVACELRYRAADFFEGVRRTWATALAYQNGDGLLSLWNAVETKIKPSFSTSPCSRCSITATGKAANTRVRRRATLIRIHCFGRSVTIRSVHVRGLT